MATVALHYVHVGVPLCGLRQKLVEERASKLAKGKMKVMLARGE